MGKVKGNLFQVLEDIISHSIESDSEKIGENLAERIEEFFKASGFSLFFLPNPPGVYAVWTKGVPDEYRNFIREKTVKLPGAQAFFTQEIMFSEDIKKDDRFSSIRKLMETGGIRAIIIFPLIFQNKSVGVLALYFRKPRSFSEEEISIGKIAASYLGSFLHNMKLYQELREEEDKLKLIFERSPAAIFIVQDDKFKFVNPASEKITGYTKEEAYRINFWELIHPDDKEVVKERGIRRQRGEKVFPETYEFKILRKNGDIRWMEFKGTPIEYERKPANLGIAFDITQRKFLEEKVKSLQESLRAIYDFSMMGIYLVSIEGGKIVYKMVNPKGKEILGVNIEGKTPEEVFSPPEAEKAKAIVKKIIGSKKPLTTIEEYHTGYGKRSLFVSRGPIFDKDGNVKEIVGLFRDITEEIRAREKAERTSKLTMIGQFTGGLAHELNNILDVILSTAEIKLKENPEDPSWRRVKRNALSASDFVSQIMELGEAAIPERTTIELNSFLKEHLKFLRKVVPERINILYSAEEKEIFLLGNPKSLKTAINNIIINSKDAIPEYGKILIGLRRVRSEEVGQIEGIKQGEEYAEIVIEDTGKGMDKEERKRAFEPFFTTKGKENPGLGLSQTYGIVKKHGGYVSLESELEKGTKLTIYLPILKERGKRKTELTKPSAPHKKMLLLVEDDMEVLEVEKEILSLSGYELKEARNGKEALILYKKVKDRVSAVLTDLTMPKMGGIELARKVKSINPKVKVIVISGYITQKEMETLRREGIDDVIQKPFEMEELLSRLKSAIG